jgi:hypothetical protein
VHPPSHVRYWQHWCVASSLRRFRAWQTREHLARRLLTASTSASTPSSTASTRRRLRPWWLPLRATVLTTPPQAPAASCAAPYPRQPRQLHVDHGYPTHGIFDHGYSPSSSVASTSARRATICMSYSPVFSPVAASALRRSGRERHDGGPPHRPRSGSERRRRQRRRRHGEGVIQGQRTRDNNGGIMGAQILRPSSSLFTSWRSS